MAENVGFCARSMRNFGLTDLRLVNAGLMEEDEWEAKEHNANFNLTEFMQKAEAVAKGGGEIVKSAKLFNSIEEACFDISRVYALSARRREISKEVITPQTAIEEAFSFEGRCAFLFGRESSGLSNKDITIAYKMVEIEADKTYSSINLGMSVGIISYLIHQKKTGSSFKEAERGIRDIASAKAVSHLGNFLEDKLENANYFKVLEKQEGMMVNIKNIFSRGNLTEAEIKTLIGIFALIKEDK